MQTRATKKQSENSGGSGGKPVVVVLARLDALAAARRSNALLSLLRNGPETTGQKDPEQWRRDCELFRLADDFLAVRRPMEKPADEAAAPHPGRLHAAPRDANGETAAGPTETVSAPSEQTAVPLAAVGLREAEKLAQMLRLLDDIGLAPFIRRQAVWEVKKQPQLLYTELYSDAAELLCTRFPSLTVFTATPLALELRRHLDRLLQAQLLVERPFERSSVGINRRFGRDPGVRPAP